MLTMYVVFLRGINVGGKSMVKMSDLVELFSGLGYSHVKTLLNSGNVVFQTEKTEETLLVKNIEQALEKVYGRTIHVILRDAESINKLVVADPFKCINVTPQTRLYVTFFSEKPTSLLKIPYESSKKDFKILSISDTELCSTLTLSSNKNTTDYMKIIEKEFGSNVTTRNWNTVLKVSALLHSTLPVEKMRLKQ